MSWKLPCVGDEDQEGSGFKCYEFLKYGDIHLDSVCYMYTIFAGLCVAYQRVRNIKRFSYCLRKRHKMTQAIISLLKAQHTKCSLLPK